MRRASVAQAVDGIPECIPGLMKRRNSVGDNGESSFVGRRGSLGHALGELAQIEEQQRQQREGAKPRRGRVIRGIQEKIAFGQKSALYGMYLSSCVPHVPCTGIGISSILFTLQGGVYSTRGL